MAKQIVVTESSFLKLKAELEYLKNVKRKEAAENVGIARSFGDLSENSEYDEAKNEQAKIEVQISELEETIAHAKVISDHEIQTDTVNVGVTVTIYDMEFDSVIISVSQGNADIGMAGMTVNEERLKTIDFTSEYYESAQVLDVREDDTVFAECKSADDIIAKLGEQEKSFKVGTQNGTTGYMYTAGDEGFGYDGFKNLTCNGYTTGALAILDLANGKIDAVILDKQPAIMIADSTNK